MAFESAGTRPNIGVMGRGFLRLVGLFAPEAREMVELMYEFEEPLILDGSKFGRAFPSFKFTPHQDAVKQTVDWFRSHSLLA